MAILKRSTKNKFWKGCSKKGTLLHFWWDCKLTQTLQRTVWRFLKKLGIKLPYDSAITLLGIYPEETIARKDTCTLTFTVALYTIVRTWKQPTLPLTDKRIRKMWYPCPLEYYLAIQRNVFESVLMRWMNLEPITQSEVSQKEKLVLYISTHIYIERI